MKTEKFINIDLAAKQKDISVESVIMTLDLFKRIKNLLIEVNFILCDKNCDNLDIIKKSEQLLKDLGIYNYDKK